jgi:hypothetical protein
MRPMWLEDEHDIVIRRFHRSTIVQPVYRCPRCRCERLARTRTRWFEQWIKPLVAARAYRCESCEWRGWIRQEATDTAGAAV